MADADTSFSSRNVESEKGDVFVLLTDGLTEVENERGIELGWEPIRELIAAQRTRPLPEIHDAVMRIVSAHGRREDDQTLALVRLNIDARKCESGEGSETKRRLRNPKEEPTKNGQAHEEKGHCYKQRENDRSRLAEHRQSPNLRNQWPHENRHNQPKTPRE
jgi:Stage II sporulation protein E (SpoIIE)